MYPIIQNPRTGERDALATQLIGQAIDERLETTQALKSHHEEDVKTISKEGLRE